MKTSAQLKEELDSFSGLWNGGFRTNRRKRHSKSLFEDFDAIERKCITPYVNGETNVLEIGCGGGFWTQKMLHAKRIICFDALSAEHNGFWKRFSKKSNISYVHVRDFECRDLENDSIDFVFSYDVFCHISYSGTEAYLKNLYPKLKKGCNCLIMIADINKFPDDFRRQKHLDVSGLATMDELIADIDGKPSPGRWYFYGTEKFCGLIEKYGYTLISKDVVVEENKRSPIIHFRK